MKIYDKEKKLNKNFEMWLNIFYVIFFLFIAILITEDGLKIELNNKLNKLLIPILEIGTFVGLGYRSYLMGNKIKFSIDYYKVTIYTLLFYGIILIFSLFIQ